MRWQPAAVAGDSAHPPGDLRVRAQQLFRGFGVFVSRMQCAGDVGDCQCQCQRSVQSILAAFTRAGSGYVLSAGEIVSRILPSTCPRTRRWLCVCRREHVRAGRWLSCTRAATVHMKKSVISEPWSQASEREGQQQHCRGRGPGICRRRSLAGPFPRVPRATTKQTNERKEGRKESRA